MKIAFLILAIRLFGFSQSVPTASEKSISVQANTCTIQNGFLAGFNDIEISTQTIAFALFHKVIHRVSIDVYISNLIVLSFFILATRRSFDLLKIHFIVPLVHSP